MVNRFVPQELTSLQYTGLAVFVVLCGIPALEMNGFGFGIPFSLPIALTCATIGGAVGGALMCSRPMVAGLVGGLLAGPIGLLAVYYYTQDRQQIWNLELVVVQIGACLPGVGVGWLIKWILAAASPSAADRGTSGSTAPDHGTND